jgi:hypothetical protein
VTIQSMQAHINDLCERNEIEVRWCKRPSQAMAVQACNEITIAPIKSDLSYAAALHELGHLLGRHQRSPRVLVREKWAWEWARRNALQWTPRMERHLRECLAWYSRRKWSRNPPDLIVSDAAE